MPAVDTTAVNAHNSAVAAYTSAMFRPLRRIGGGANDALIIAAGNAATAALAATNAATVNASQAAALAYQLRKYSRQQKNITAVLGVKRRHALRSLRGASRAIAALHQVNV